MQHVVGVLPAQVIRVKHHPWYWYVHDCYDNVVCFSYIELFPLLPNPLVYRIFFGATDLEIH